MRNFDPKKFANPNCPICDGEGEYEEDPRGPNYPAYTVICECALENIKSKEDDLSNPENWEER